MDSMTTYAACARIQTEYIEMPDLKLTVAQVRRLCGLRADVCDAAVRVLVANGFLCEAANGALLRRSASERRRLIPARPAFPLS